MKTQPRTMSRISYHVRRLEGATGEERPVIEGRALADGLLGEGTKTNVSRHTPRVSMADAPFAQLAGTQVPCLRTFPDGQLKHWSTPDPAQVEQLLSQLEHPPFPPLLLSKKEPFEHARRQRPDVKTGRVEWQVEHWLNAGPVHDAQSAWQGRHCPF